jgi:hypothetical protein
MKRGLLLAVAAFLSGAASAQPIHLYGAVGKAPVFLDLSRNGDTVSGWYFYLKTGKQIRLEGKLNPRGFFQIEEFTGDTNSHTGTFTGRIKDGHWAGDWRNAAKRKSRDIAFDELRGRLADINGRFKCAAKRRDGEFGFTTNHSLDVTFAKGRIAAFSMAREQHSDDGDDQSCSISRGSFRQLPAPVGILLRAKADSSRSGQHCTIRIYRAGDYLVVRTGDPSQAGDDCRGAGDTKFCSPRSFWADIVVNRKTQVCKAVE